MKMAARTGLSTHELRHERHTQIHSISNLFQALLKYGVPIGHPQRIGVTHIEFMLTESRAFERAFLIAMPADVEGLHVEGYYVPESYGLQSNLWIGLLLDADHHQLEELLSQIPAGRNRELEEMWAGDPDYVWGILFGGFVPQAGAAWQEPPLTDHIEIYQSEFARKEFTRILWDGVAERAYAFYMRS